MSTIGHIDADLLLQFDGRAPVHLASVALPLKLVNSTGFGGVVDVNVSTDMDEIREAITAALDALGEKP